MIMYLILGLAIGGIVPTVVTMATVLKGLRMEIKGYDEMRAKMEQAERDIRQLRAEVDHLTRKDWRIEIPYDAMGDYSELKESMAKQQGFVADVWYRENFGGKA